MTHMAVWQPTEASIGLATRLRNHYARGVYEDHKDWRRDSRSYQDQSPYNPHGHRGDVSVDDKFTCPLGGQITLINTIGEVDWHDDRGASEYAYSYFLILRNRHYIVRQKDEAPIPDQPLGCLMRVNTFVEHALLRKHAAVLDHGLWLAMFFEHEEKIDDPDLIVGAFTEGCHPL